MATVPPEQITATQAEAQGGEVDATMRPAGAAVAAMLSIGIGALAMAIVVGFSDASAAFNNGFVHSVGKAWVPGAQGIGPYSGKFTLLPGRLAAELGDRSPGAEESRSGPWQVGGRELRAHQPGDPAHLAPDY